MRGRVGCIVRAGRSGAAGIRADPSGPCRQRQRR